MNKDLKRKIQPITILVAEGNPEDRLLVEKAFLENHLSNDLTFVKDGKELMDYLYEQGKYATDTSAPRPCLIILGLNLPYKDGREALAEIKSNPDLRSIPVVVLSSSQDEEDILRTYNLGVAGFIIKPVTFESLVEIVTTLNQYWFEIVELPKNKNGKEIRYTSSSTKTSC